MQKRGSKTFGPVLAKKKGGREITDEDHKKAAEVGLNAYYDKKKALENRCGSGPGSDICEDENKSMASSALSIYGTRNSTSVVSPQWQVLQGLQSFSLR